jgi:cardiolipin synthase
MDHWLKIRGDLLHGRDYFPPLPAVGGLQGTVFYASPEHGTRNVEIMMNLAISSARRSLLIENAYFVPDTKTVDALCAAAKRGVRVQIIIPGEHIDQPAVRRASRTRWGKLLEAGVEIYEYEPTMLHTKLLIADDLFVSVGSANLDYRSLRINAEANLNVLDKGFAAEQARIFRRDLQRSRRVTLEEWRRRRPMDAIIQAVEYPITPLL